MDSDRLDVLVTGDIVLDRHIYEGRRSSLHDRSSPGTTLLDEVGGAALTERLIAAVLEADFNERRKAWKGALRISKKEGTAAPTPPERLVSKLGLKWPRTLRSWPDELVASAWWSAQAKTGSKDRFWRVSRAFGYGPTRRGCCR